MIERLGYVGVRADGVEDWSAYATHLLGLQQVDGSRATRAFRMDDRKQRLLVDGSGGKGIACFGWEVADAAALDAFAARLDRAGVAVTRGTRALADERRVKDLVTFVDPAGYRLEIVHGAETADTAFKPGRTLSGFRTGALGMGHVVLQMKEVAPVLAFYRDVLGFKLSDYFLRPFPAYFMRVNPRHHSIAFMQTGTDGAHHLMLEAFSFDDVGQGYDLAQLEPEKLAITLGRHSGDYLTSFYTHNPSGFMTEFGWGSQCLDDDWQPFERTLGSSFWGHDRTSLSPEQLAAARAARVKGVSVGVRQPVQVVDGNYRLNPGVCPWWDSVKRASA